MLELARETTCSHHRSEARTSHTMTTSAVRPKLCGSHQPLVLVYPNLNLKLLKLLNPKNP